ncbi:3-methyladenine DNA glycosylase AlkD [Ekhidna lutea]|uniref:3-methyladenine DNA glycosylase AlkD n=1 Tax=Ekhidna lutea TaxID=447679 RepID=A0A239KAH9_EKHLU|nr:DNA alkylation repair protein [Ekhidna lutea]SNT15011.1 3-methyladenine DNA glycosylase AlkD [Ekhidna lutea]
MKTIEEILSDLQSLADPEYISKMEYFGIKGGQALGIKNAVLKPYAKEIGRNQELANELWNQPMHECKHLAILLAEPKLFTEEIAEKWTRECYSWDLVDGIGMKIIPQTDFAYRKVDEWSTREPEYEKRMAFATMVGLSLKGAKQPDEKIRLFFPIIEREAWDERNFVKKAVNWALRQIGKRNSSLNKEAIQVAERIKAQGSKAARWIATDALRELKSDKAQARLHK